MELQYLRVWKYFSCRFNPRGLAVGKTFLPNNLGIVHATNTGPTLREEGYIKTRMLHPRLHPDLSAFSEMSVRPLLGIRLWAVPLSVL